MTLRAALSVFKVQWSEKLKAEGETEREGVVSKTQDVFIKRRGNGRACAGKREN